MTSSRREGPTLQILRIRSDPIIHIVSVEVALKDFSIRSLLMKVLVKSFSLSLPNPKAFGVMHMPAIDSFTEREGKTKNERSAVSLAARDYRNGHVSEWPEFASSWLQGRHNRRASPVIRKPKMMMVPLATILEIRCMLLAPQTLRDERGPSKIRLEVQRTDQ